MEIIKLDNVVVKENISRWQTKTTWATGVYTLIIDRYYDSKEDIYKYLFKNKTPSIVMDDLYVAYNGASYCRSNKHPAKKFRLAEGHIRDVLSEGDINLIINHSNTLTCHGLHEIPLLYEINI